MAREDMSLADMGGSRSAGEAMGSGRWRRYDPAVIARYTRPAMARIWSEEAKLAAWLEVELAALDGWAELGAVPRMDVSAIRDAAQAPTPERVAEIERETH